jgi:hypothetical protein
MENEFQPDESVKAKTTNTQECLEQHSGNILQLCPIAV